jgi:tetratricopeptide (TPR) repeat protein
VTSAAVADRPTPAALLEAARSEVGHGNRRAALGLYERLRSFYPTSPEAHTVLPTIGRLYLDLGDANRALRNFDAYLSNPGALAPEALSGKIRALRGLGQHSAEREAIQRYLARYPRGLEAPRFEKRLAELDRR